MSLFGFNLNLGRPVRVRAEVMSGWGRPRTGHVHAGIDIPLPVGTPIYAMADGTVTRVQATPDGDAGGIRIAVKHAGGIQSRYMHLSRAEVPLGARVRKGQRIGLSGNTGIHSSGPHLHADLKAPAALLPAIEAAVGKPTSGWGPLMPSYGYAIPAEPWIPVDVYNARTVADAKANGIPLYTSRSAGGIVKVALVAVISWGVYKLLR
jgi:murein DD-endopeptidase MepM/ murein hydrolase activator NlpD